MSNKKENKKATMKNEIEQERKEIKVSIKTGKATKKGCKKCSELALVKKENELLKKKRKNLELQIHKLKQDNEKEKQAFLIQARGFEEKAKQAIEEFKSQHKEKVDDDVAHIKKYASSRFFKDFIEPWLNLSIAVEFGAKQEDQGVKNYVVGFKMLLKQIDSIMQSHGLTKIEPSIKEKFNPQTMEAISSVKKDGFIDKVIEIKKDGFKYHDRVIKPATVIIGK